MFLSQSIAFTAVQRSPGEASIDFPQTYSRWGLSSVCYRDSAYFVLSMLILMPFLCCSSALYFASCTYAFTFHFPLQSEHIFSCSLCERRSQLAWISEARDKRLQQAALQHPLHELVSSLRKIESALHSGCVHHVVEKEAFDRVDPTSHHITWVADNALHRISVTH